MLCNPCGTNLHADEIEKNTKIEHQVHKGASVDKVCCQEDRSGDGSVMEKMPMNCPTPASAVLRQLVQCHCIQVDLVGQAR